MRKSALLWRSVLTEGKNSKNMLQFSFATGCFQIRTKQSRALCVICIRVLSEACLRPGYGFPSSGVLLRA